MANRLVRNLLSKFHDTFTIKDAPIIIVGAPGRINLIGEHVDYNGGIVLPATINKLTYFIFSKSGTTTCNIVAEDLNDSIHLEMAEKFEPIDNHWSNYVMGVVEELKKKGCKPEGFNCIFSSEIPIGAGLSSSAALEGGIAMGLNELFQFGLNRLELALVGQAAEHNYVGVMCGIMDQYANLFGKENHAIEIDCNTLDFNYHHASFDDVCFLLFDTQVSHALDDSEYNNRRIDCEAGVSALKILYPEIENLRDVNNDQLKEALPSISQQVYDRCKFVIDEIDRVKQAVVALEKSDFQLFGKLMYKSHEGLSQGYEVSCKELDFLVDQSMDYSAILGARMMGGGFGGCTLNLVHRDFKSSMISTIEENYLNKFGHEMKVYEVITWDGTKIIPQESVV